MSFYGAAPALNCLADCNFQVQQSNLGPQSLSPRGISCPPTSRRLVLWPSPQPWGHVDVCQASLGEKPKPGRTVLSVDVDGKAHVICTLIAEKFEMQPLDLMFGAAQQVRASIARPL